MFIECGSATSRERYEHGVQVHSPLLKTVHELWTESHSPQGFDHQKLIHPPVVSAQLQRPRATVGGRRDVEDDGVGVQLRRVVAGDRSGAVVFEARRDPLARGLGRMQPADRACT